MKNVKDTGRIDTVAQHVAILPDPPCEKYNCHLFDKCKNELLACDAFFMYTRTDRLKVIDPHYQRVFKKGKKGGLTSRLAWKDEIKPTREIYNKVFEIKEG